jgi:plastocyanin
MKLKSLSTLLCLALVALVAAGCGSSDKKSSSSSAAPAPAPASSSGGAAPSGGASTNLSLSADKGGQLKFDKSSLSAKAGNVTITMDNPSSVPHAIAIDGQGTPGSTVGNGGKSTVTVNLKPGTYTYFCPVDGHRDAGMQGTLTVK